MARNGASKDEIMYRIVQDYYALGFNLDDIRGIYQFNETCQETVPTVPPEFDLSKYEDILKENERLS